MLAPLSWLKEFVTLPPLEKLVDRLNQTGTTIAAVNHYGEGLEDIIVGEILEVSPHPNADKLSLAKVKVPGKILEIVCGAKNIAPGQKVPVVPIGGTVPVGPDGQPIKIERRAIRGVFSQGMLASAKELGLGDDHAGILILDPDLKVGMKLTKVLNLPETVLDIEVTTNRGDELSIYGLAREIAAVTEGKLKKLGSPKLSAEVKPVDLTVKISDANLSPRYSAVAIGELKIGPSPSFMQMRLRQAGMRPVNNIVDITNYVMLETGQPLHAFDQSKIKGGILVRESKPGERLTTLDGVTRVLGYGSIVIADQEKVLGLGGVMGGERSGISDLTETIVLESAVFDPVAIRRTAIKYNLRNEASTRFERGVDIEGTIRAQDVAAELFKNYAGGKIASPVVDIYHKAFIPVQVTLTQEKLDQYLGYHYPLSDAVKILKKLGFDKAHQSKVELSASVPSWRAQDVSIEEDLIEEVARIVGYDKIPGRLPTGEIPPALPYPKLELIKKIKNHLASTGLSEVLTYPMVSQDLVGENQALKIVNSISTEWEYLRTSLIPGLAQTAALNINLGNEPKIFEVGKVYLPREGDLPDERDKLGLAGGSFAIVKGYFESILERLGLPEASYLSKSRSEFLDEDSAKVVLSDQPVGWIGAASPIWRAKTGLRQSLVVGEFDLETLFAKLPTEKTFRLPPKFPSVRQDLSISIADDISVAEIVRTVVASRAMNLARVEPFDIFADSKLGQGKKSVSLELTFQSPEKTLTDVEVREEKNKIEKVLKEKLQAKIR